MNRLSHSAAKDRPSLFAPGKATKRWARELSAGVPSEASPPPGALLSG